MNSIYEQIVIIENGNQKAVLCTIIATKGSSPRKVGAKMIVFENASIFGTIGGGALEKKVIEEALKVLETNLPVIVSHNLVKELEMCCGGTVELFLEPIMNKKKLLIFGAGHIGNSLARFAYELDFKVSLIDERIELFENIGTEINCMIENHVSAIEKSTFDSNTYVVIVTHDHAFDREILALCSKRNPAYIGMIGSQRKVEVAKKMLLSSELLDENEISKVDMPIGIDISAKTPQEIAISILAKLIELRNSTEN